MTNRNDLEVAHSRIASLERETRALAEQNALLTARLEPEPEPKPKPKAKRLEPTPPAAVASPVESEADEERWLPWFTTLLVAALALATTAIILTTGQT